MHSHAFVFSIVLSINLGSQLLAHFGNSISTFMRNATVHFAMAVSFYVHTDGVSVLHVLDNTSHFSF